MGDEKDGFDEFLKNFILKTKRHRIERGWDARVKTLNRVSYGFVENQK